MKSNADGSPDIYIQHNSQGKDEEAKLAACTGRRFHYFNAGILAERRNDKQYMAPPPPVKKMS